MKFLDVKTDYAFKKVFGSDQSHNILISFLNAVIHFNHDLKQFPEIRCHFVNTPIEGLYSLITESAEAFVYPKQIVEYLAQELRLSDKRASSHYQRQNQTVRPSPIDWS